MLSLHQLETAVRDIVSNRGGNREREILKRPHDYMPDPETWNRDHKVVHVLCRDGDESGHRPGFEIDLVTGIICG